MMQHTDDSTVTLTAPTSPITAGENLLRTEPSLGFGVAVLISTSHSRLAGIVQEIWPHTISILVKQPVPEGSAVSIEFGAVTRIGDVLSCYPNAGRFEICVVIPNWNEPELRAAERFPLTEEVQVHVDGLEAPLPALIVDVCAHGVGLEVSTPLEKGRIVTLESDSNIAFGTIRHCRGIENGRFHAGVEVFHIMSKQD